MKCWTVALALLAFLPSSLVAIGAYQDSIPNGQVFSCMTCHYDLGSLPARSALGVAFRNNGYRWTERLARIDSDADGATNGAELGDPNGSWRPGDPDPGGEIFNPGDYTSVPGGSPLPLPVFSVSHSAAAPPGDPEAGFWSGLPEVTVVVRAIHGSTGLFYPGEFNMSRAQPESSAVILRGVYTDTDLYIWARWRDGTGTHDLHRRRSLFNYTDFGAAPDTLLPGWSSNWNDDKLAVMFDIDPASNFATQGCAAACHVRSGDPASDEMAPYAGKVDLWHWKSSRSNPLGYVNDQFADVANGRRSDANETIEVRNLLVSGDVTQGPKYVWDPRHPRRTGVQDPLFTLLAGDTMRIEGDAVRGDSLYANVAPACIGCHGADGTGFGVDLADHGLDEATDDLIDVIRSGRGIMPGYSGLSDQEVLDLIARVRAFAGVPGYYLKDPSDPAGATVVLNYTDAFDSTDGEYTLILKRALQDATPDDAPFDPAGGPYPFAVATMDFDGKNHAGSLRWLLAFEPVGIGGSPGTEVPVLPRAFSLGPNYPNPAAPATVIPYEVPGDDRREGASLAGVRPGTPVILQIFTVRGVLVRTLEQGRRSAGQYIATWDGRDDRGRPVPSGTYLYRLVAPGFAQARRMVVLK